MAKNYNTITRFIIKNKWWFIAGGALVLISQLPSISFKNVNKFNDAIRASAKKWKIPYVILKGLIATESSFNPQAAAGTTSAKGLTQLTRAAAQDIGVSYDLLNDPTYSIDAGAKYLNLMRNKFGLLGGIKAYYQGAGNQIKNTDSNPLNDTATKYDAEKYLSKVLSYAVAFALDIGSHF